MTPATDQGMSLFQLESELAELMAFRDQEELTPEERVAVNGQIAEYVKRELTKVDNLRAYMRHCAIMSDAAKEEAERQLKRASSWKNRLDFLKGCCLDAMNVIGKKRLDGRTGYLISKANGGKQALTIYDENLVPEAFCCYEGRIAGDLFTRILSLLGIASWNEAGKQFKEGMRRVPLGEAIRAAIEKPCEYCKGTGHFLVPSGDPLPDPECNGTGKQQVPGARLEPRGTHVEVK